MSLNLVRSAAQRATSTRTAATLLLPSSSFSRYASTVSPSSASVAPQSTPVSLSNIEASWKTLTPAQQESTFQALEELQKKDWKELSLDEKKASYYVAFGPHGPREPILPAGSGVKTFGGVAACILVGCVMFAGVRTLGSPAPRTLTKEWQEASTERAIEQKQDPFSGPSSPGYAGKGYVTK